MNSRPKPGETEEDILRLQEEFLKNQLQPSAKYINCSEKRGNEQIEESKEESKLEEPRTLLGGIVERKPQFVPPDLESKSRFSGGFPQAKRRQNITGTKKGSIFSQQNKRLKDENVPETVHMITEDTDTASGSATSEKNLPAQSYIISGKESAQIHRENLDTLSKMSEKDILDEQQKLVSTLDPDIVRFLKSKRTRTEAMSVSESDEHMSEQEEPVNVQQIEVPKGILENCDTEKWLHFDLVEPEKLQWMQDIDLPKKLAANEEYEARFDFAGWLLPYVDTEISEKNRTLYHHGEEPGRPGYTLKELFQLCRSNVQQQRILALNTVANILQLTSTGIYDDVIDIPVEQIFFIIRVSLDDNTPTVLNASIRAMHSLFCYRIDEMCLDSLFGFGYGQVQPMLTVDKQETSKEEESELNDQQMAEQDLVKCLARTDIVTRIRYIINTVKPTAETIVYCVELLIRLFRDSHLIMLQVYQCDGLFASIIQHFVPRIYQLNNDSPNCYGVPLPAAIKLLRIAAARSSVIAEELINKYDIMPAICSYISNDIGQSRTGVRIQTETFNFLATVLHYRLAVDNFRELEYPFLRTLNYHFRHTHIDANTSFTLQRHFAALMNVVSQACLIDSKHITNFVPLLTQCVTKYCVQVSNLTDFKCGKLQIISSLLTTMGDIVKCSSRRKYEYVERPVEAMLGSHGFAVITANIKLGSNLLCEYEPHKSGANLGSVEAAVWRTSEHIVPCLHQQSCIPFLAALSHYAEQSCARLKLKLLLHLNMLKYLTALKDCAKLNLITNWFTRIESRLLVNIFRSVFVSKAILRDRALFYDIPVKCLPIFNTELKIDVSFILRYIVFRHNFLPNEVPLEHLSLHDAKFDMNAVNYLDDTCKCYCHILGLNQNIDILTTDLTLDIRIGNIMPVDWIFSPIVSVYADHQARETPNTDDSRLCLTVTRCLQWVLVFETHFPTLAALVNPTERFCRLACVFLCSNSLFLEKRVHCLLEKCLKMLLRDHSTALDFDREIQGLNNFQDFYVQLLEQYQAVSYGDTLFANYILVPLAQKHNVKWRKILWSEYMGVAQTITLSKDQCFINIQEFLDPVETDLSVLKCYRQALMSGYLNRSPLLQEITSYHVERYVQNTKQ